MNNQNLDNLKIVKYLKNINSIFYHNILNIYSLCDVLLSEIPKLFSNYTIHDINHSIRVIEYMTKFLTKPLQNYSELHLAAIVYVGLMHDIGMFASDEEIQEIKCVLKETGKRDKDPIEISNYEIQDYIRVNHGKRVEKSLDYKLNNGSSLKSQLFVNSYDISDIIVKVCRSHTESCEWIKENISTERKIAEFSINPIHLAILLRLGDVLDIDDRRAPLSLYYALSPKGLSDSEWQKHIPITNYDKVTVKNDIYYITFEGECKNPEIFMALKRYIEQLNFDISKINKILEHQDDLYKFTIENNVVNSISAINFSPKEVTFKLQYKQIKKLLMGEHLYGGRENGLRELIQNSIDAVKVMQEINSNKSLVSYEPTIEIFLNKDSNEIIITDNGIGMSENVLDEFFFNIGNSFYKSDKYIKSGYEYKAIGKFGIGFLACFMLSSEVSVITKHYESTDVIRIDLNNNSDLIVTRHMNTFPANSGTQVILKYDETIDEVFHKEEKLIEYIQNLLIIDRYKLSIKSNNALINVENHIPKEFSHVINGEKMNIYYNNGSFFELIENCNNLTNNCCYIYLPDEHENYDSFYDDGRYLTIDYLYEIIDEIEQYIASNYEKLTKEDLKDLLVDDSKDFGFSGKYHDLFLNRIDEIYNYYCLHENIIGYFNEYILNSSTVKDTVTWKDIPYFKNVETYEQFMEDIENGYNYLERLSAYNANYVSVFCANELDDDLKISILTDHFELMECNTYFDYWDKYELGTIEKKLFVLKENDTYMSIEKEYSFKQNNVRCDVYVNGILIPNINIVLPFVPTGFQQERICINITTDEYEINVARDNLTDQSREKFIKDFVREFLYGYISASPQLSQTEKQLIEVFIKEYYPI